jgi:hypothetical protein
VKFTAELIESFSALYLSHRYDEAARTPQFHRECWERYSDDSLWAAATAAPRKHAKTTALTHDFIIAACTFRWVDFVVLIGSSEDLAKDNLGNIAMEFRTNVPLRRDFGIGSLSTDQKTDIIVECLDGHQFRILARGAQQLIRGLIWKGARPGLIVADDIEDDAAVANKDVRDKFKRWFFRAARQALREGGKMRVHGTIMHDDSLLANLMRNASWDSKLYKAHESFDDFSNILWPDKFSPETLRKIRQEFIDAVDSEGYAQEYLNDPRDRSDAYLKQEWFRPMEAEDYGSAKVFAVGVDLAISKADRANRTSFTVGGKDIGNVVHVVDQRCGRWDALEIVDEFFSLQAERNPEAFFVEDGVIWKAIEPVMRAEMAKRDKWLNVIPKLPVKDKATRGRSLQKRMRSGGMRFDREASWYPSYENELLRFTGNAEATLDDQFDSSAILSAGLEEWNIVQEDIATDEEIAFERESESIRMQGSHGRSMVTGY